jgi:hypothetical protein
MWKLLALLLTPVAALAQAPAPTEFPSNAIPVASEALKQRLMGKVFLVNPVIGAPLRVEYRDTYAFVNVGNFSDSGKWRVEGSSICVDWKKVSPSCSDARLVGDILYVKRANNGEIVVMQPK